MNTVNNDFLILSNQMRIMEAFLLQISDKETRDRLNANLTLTQQRLNLLDE